MQKDPMGDISAAIKETQSAYHRIAAQYDAVTQPFKLKVSYPKLISLLQEHFISLDEKSILDSGCGSGVLMQLLRALGARCVGIDVTPDFVLAARANGHPAIRASMHELPFRDEIFDAVVSHCALNYLPPEGQRLALRENRRVLKPGGVMIILYMHPFFMRVSRYASDSPQYRVVAENYFRPVRRHVVQVLERTFTLYLWDWPEIATAVIESGFRLKRLIDGEPPEHMAEIMGEIAEPSAAEFVRGFQFNPYGIWIVAVRDR